MAYTAVVTGASGYVASYIIKGLLEKGYNVRGTVRPTSTPSGLPRSVSMNSVPSALTYGMLSALEKALPGKLALYEADLTVPGSFDEAIRGADFVFHVASPLLASYSDAQQEQIDPAINGTKNVLDSVAKAGTVKRVVLTSSTFSVAFKKEGPANGSVYTEADFSTAHTLDSALGAYGISKVGAEQAAWQLAKELSIDLVTICPSLVLGPVLAKNKALIAGWSTAIAEGKVDIFAKSALITDFKTVAAAHIAAAENPAAKGRYIVSHPKPLTGREMSQILSARFPQYKFERGSAELLPEYQGVVVSSAKLEAELGIKLPPIAETLADMCVAQYQLGLASPVLDLEA